MLKLRMPMPPSKILQRLGAGELSRLPACRQRMQDVEYPSNVQPLPEPFGTSRPRMDAEPSRGVIRTKRGHGIGGNRGRRRDVGQRLPVRTPEPELTVRPTSDLISLFVHGAMVPATQQREVCERRRPTVCPVPEVMALTEGQSAPRKPTSAIAMEQRTPQRRRNRSGARADLEHASVRVMPHHDST